MDINNQPSKLRQTIQMIAEEKLKGASQILRSISAQMIIKELPQKKNRGRALFQKEKKGAGEKKKQKIMVEG